MVLLVLHGCAGVLWVTSSQMLLYDIVGPDGAAERGAPERDGALPRRARRARRRQPDHAHARADARHLPQHGVLPAAVLWLVARAVRPALPRRRRRRRSARCAASPTSSQTIRDVRGIPVARRDDPARGRGVVLRRQQLPGADAGLRARPRPRRPGRRLHAAARRRRGGRAARAASCSRAAAAASRTQPRVGAEARHRSGRAALARLRAHALAIRSRSRCSSWPASSSSRSAAWRRRSCR